MNPQSLAVLNALATPHLRAAALAAVLLAPALPAPAGGAEAFDTAAAGRGRQVVEDWCRGCHLRARDRPDADMALPYERIVLRPGRDRAYFERFFREDHFPMTTYRLFENEKADVVEYLLSLKPQ
ncbi:hypothetical protein [Hoeflea marina]|uniref:hypothetical protein n=1 Tax=Hoeflea marina TaxID=274592 RepID=UPI001AEC7D86|nr:hypothetical protein [Hoeflea marina]